ncbi:MAG: hypothetical protein P8X91_09945, partial [Candidatus Bathyarchaeota archaeon]
AVTYDKVIDLFTEAKIEEIKRIQNNKDKLVSEWESIYIKEQDQKTDKFAVLEERKFIYSKIRQIAQETKSNFCAIFPLSTLFRLDNYGVFDSIESEKDKSKVSYNFITDPINQDKTNENLINQRKFGLKLDIRLRNPNFGLRLFPSLVIRDNEEILLFIKPRNPNSNIEIDENALWTNCKSIIDSFKCVFENLWKNSIIFNDKNIKQSISETKKENKSQYFETKLIKILDLAKNEITAICSIDGLTYFLNKLYSNKKKVKIIKILAPITRDNYTISQHLPKNFEIRHLSETNLETIIIDEKHIFQFNLSKSVNEDIKSKVYLKNTFYSNDSDFVLKMKIMLENLWINSPPLSKISLDSLLEKQTIIPDDVTKQDYTFSKSDSPYRKMIISYTENPGSITEQEVLKKFNLGKRYPIKNIQSDKAVFYGCRGATLIHPPNFFNLPEMIINVSHWNENSSYGPENWMVINLLTKTVKGPKFVPSAFIQDRSVGMNLKKDIYKDTPAAENIQLLKSDEFKILFYGETLFAGWTKPILLNSKKYVLPPGCLIFESYGKVKSGIIDSIVPSGRRNNWQYNGFEAFVTFFHPSSKYSGPGIEKIDFNSTM